LTPVSFDHVNFTAVADKHVHREDIEQVKFSKIHQCEVKIRRCIITPNHLPPICFCTTVIYNVVSRWFIQPGTLNLDFDEGSVDIKD
jgi:hypothetical protein